MTAVPPASGSEAFAAHSAAVARFARRMGITGVDLDDLVQDVFLAAHGVGGYREGAASERTWYLRLAWYAVVRHRRRLHRAPQALDAVEPSVAAEQHRALESRERSVRIEAALDSLPETHRAVLVLFELEGYRADEIAAALRIPIGTVHSRLHHARRKLASELNASRAAAQPLVLSEVPS